MTELWQTNLFAEGDVSAAILRTWWKGLQADQEERDRIRRCGDPLSVALSPEYQRLVNLLKQAGYHLDGGHTYALAAVAGVVAQVTSDTGPGASFARQMAKPAAGSRRARVSGLRLDRLVAERERRMACLLLMPVMELLSGAVNLADMAYGLYRWDTVVRKLWADDYHRAASGSRK